MRKIPSAVLWAAAIVTTALIIVTAGRLPDSTAHAEMATTGNGGFSLVSASSGFGPKEERYEFLFVIDNQTQTLLVYAVDNAADRRINLRGGSFLPSLFRVGRGG